MVSCFHCGDDCANVEIHRHDRSFCCNGCKTVYDILNENGLTYYYELDQTPGVSRQMRSLGKVRISRQ